MDRICLLENKIQYYKWGSYSAIPDLLGAESDRKKPCAELWMGAHPKASSMVRLGNRKESLLSLIDEDPETILGKKTAQRFHGKLPYLFKVLAAEKPLSLQAHPNSVQAVEGFKTENQKGIPLDAYHRSYKDDQHKPECICALTEFWGINGFRKISKIISLLDMIRIPELDPLMKLLKQSIDSRGLKDFFYGLMSLDQNKKDRAVVRLLEQIKGIDWDNSIKSWIKILSQTYPNDIGIFSPIIMNLVCLKPGEAMFLKAGDLHAYLKGVGIEIMANSDNVLRGGLTPKYIDIQELLKVLNFSDQSLKILNPIPNEKGEKIYSTPAEEFKLSSIRLRELSPYYSDSERSAEILLCTHGYANISDLHKDRIIKMKKGDSVIIPASVKEYIIKGNAEFFKAGVPL